MEKFVTITPARVRLTGPAGTKIATSVKIIPEKKYPFNIISTKTQRGQNITYKLEKKENSLKNDEYILLIENLKQEPGRYFDIIYLKTDSSLRPEIKITIAGNIITKEIKSKKNDEQGDSKKD